MRSPVGSEGTTTVASQALQLLLFELGGKGLAVDLGCVERIIAVRPALPTPRPPAWVDGVAEDRGRFLAIFNLRRRFGLPDRRGPHAAIVLIRGLDLDPLIGISVDRVLQVLTLSPDAILVPPPRVFGVRADYIRGVANLGGWPVVWLDLGKLLTATEPITLLQ